VIRVLAEDKRMVLRFLTGRENSPSYIVPEAHVRPTKPPIHQQLAGEADGRKAHPKRYSLVFESSSVQVSTGTWAILIVFVSVFLGSFHSYTGCCLKLIQTTSFSILSEVLSIII
jgi:hypothetical protein